MQESRVCSLHFPRLSGWAFGACSQQPKPQNLGVPVVYSDFPRANAILARAHAGIALGTRLVQDQREIYSCPTHKYILPSEYKWINRNETRVNTDGIQMNTNPLRVNTNGRQVNTNVTRG